MNGSPIETLSAWMRSRPQTVAELHRSYLSDGHVAQKKVQMLLLSCMNNSSTNNSAVYVSSPCFLVAKVNNSTLMLR